MKVVVICNSSIKHDNALYCIPSCNDCFGVIIATFKKLFFSQTTVYQRESLCKSLNTYCFEFSVHPSSQKLDRNLFNAS